MKPVDYSQRPVFDIAMAPALMLTNTYYIFRSMYQEITITTMGRKMVTSDKLTDQEIRHIKKEYPHWNVKNYSIKQEQE